MRIETLNNVPSPKYLEMNFLVYRKSNRIRLTSQGSNFYANSVMILKLSVNFLIGHFTTILFQKMFFLKTKLKGRGDLFSPSF